MAAQRRSYEDSWRELQRVGMVDDGDIPPPPDRMPHIEDEELRGVNIYKMGWESVTLANLTMPHSFFGRSELRQMSFVNCDLSKSVLCWNDFIDVDFSLSTLVGSDLRASIYTRVNFEGADLTNCDLRGSSFKGCMFSQANLQGAKVCKGESVLKQLSPAQLTAVQIVPWEGEPDGG